MMSRSVARFVLLPLIGLNCCTFGSQTKMPTFPPVPQAIIDKAAAEKPFRMYRNKQEYALTAGVGGANIVLAVAALQGNESADAPLLERIRYSLVGENAIVAGGGYWTQHERHVTGMYALAKLTPRVWDRLTADEKKKIDLLMKAATVAAAFTTADAAYEGGKKPRSIEGDTNLSRGWNPNYREGLVGMMIVSVAYFGGADAVDKVLDTYDHDAFVAQLRDAGLTNPLTTFTWHANHPGQGESPNFAQQKPGKGKSWAPGAPAPDGPTIAATIRDYRYLGDNLSDPMKLYYGLTVNTYGRQVNAGLKDGQGIDGAGKIVSGAEGLPNVGKDGMLLEFASSDANGPRSSAGYAYGGFRPNLTNQIVLRAAGYWTPGPMADECLDRMNVGITDLFYKIDHGYRDYSKGKADESVFDRKKNFDFDLAWSLWNDVIRVMDAK